MTLQVCIYAASIFGAAFLGGALPLTMKDLHENHLKLFVTFGAGLLLGMAFLHMLPEAAEMIPSTFGVWLLAGFLVLLVLERFVMVHACDEHGCHYHTIGVAAFAGLCIHGVIEGFALASSLFVGKLGFLVLIAILAHKIPSGVALTSILQLASKPKKQILWFAFGVACSGPLGLILAYNLLIHESIPNAAGALLAMSIGTFIYISACDLLPELHRSDTEKKKRLATFFLGIIVAYVSGYLTDLHGGHHHGPQGHHSTPGDKTEPGFSEGDLEPHDHDGEGHDHGHDH
jgi:zinc and cadmium transporter